jgi:hypothetical protein
MAPDAITDAIRDRLALLTRVYERAVEAPSAPVNGADEEV